MIKKSLMLSIAMLSSLSVVQGNALHKAAYDCSIEGLRECFEGEEEFDINGRGEDGRAPLHMAIYGNSKSVEPDVESDRFLRVVNILVGEEGVDVTAVDDCGMTPLHEAALHGYVEAAYIIVNTARMNGCLPQLIHATVTKGEHAGRNAFVVALHQLNKKHDIEKEQCRQFVEFLSGYMGN